MKTEEQLLRAYKLLEEKHFNLRNSLLFTPSDDTGKRLRIYQELQSLEDKANAINFARGLDNTLAGELRLLGYKDVEKALVKGNE